MVVAVYPHTGLCQGLAGETLKGLLQIPGHFIINGDAQLTVHEPVPEQCHFPHEQFASVFGQHAAVVAMGLEQKQRVQGIPVETGVVGLV